MQLKDQKETSPSVPPPPGSHRLEITVRVASQLAVDHANLQFVVRNLIPQFILILILTLILRRAGGAGPPEPRPNNAGPLLQCCVCWEYHEEAQGLACRLEDERGRHFVCRDSLQGYVNAQVDGERLLIHRGAIPCPGRDAGGRRCGSQAWEVAHLLPHLEQQTLVRLSHPRASSERLLSMIV